MTIEHVIFDCDGVLIDSEAISMKLDQRLFAALDIHFIEKELHERFVGQTFAMMLATIESDYHRTLPPDLSARKDAMMIAAYAQELQAIAGIKDMLKNLTLPCSIATNGPRQRALAALDYTGLRSFFGDRLTTFEDVTHGKPAPDVYLLAAKRAGFKPAHCLVVEDSVTGATAALAAGCPVIGFTGVSFDRAESTKALTALGVRLILTDMADLIPALARLNA